MAEKEMPQSIPSEQSLLGLMIQYSTSVAAAEEQGVIPTDFYTRAHQIIFKAMMDLDHENKIVDITSLSTRLNDTGDLEKVGGVEYLLRLVEMGDADAKKLQYIDTIRKKSLLRQLIAAAEEIRNDAMARSYDEDDVLNLAGEKIRRITESRQRADFRSSREVAPQVVDYITTLKNAKNREGVRTGLARLDRCTAGFKPGDLIILAARTSVGKTAFSVNIAVNAAIKYRKSVAIFTLEMSAEQIITRMLAVDQRLPSEHLKTGEFTPVEENKLQDAERDLVNAEIHIDDTSMIRVAEIYGKCKKLRSELEARGKKLDLIIIDYLQLVTANRESDSRQQDVSAISRGLKQLGREIGCPVIALSQLSRANVTRKDSRPQLSDLRESGAIEQDADIVIFLHNEDEIVEDKPQRKVKLIVGKHRNGALMEDDLFFNTVCGVFLEASDMEEPGYE